MILKASLPGHAHEQTADGRGWARTRHAGRLRSSAVHDGCRKPQKPLEPGSFELHFEYFLQCLILNRFPINHFGDF